MTQQLMKSDDQSERLLVILDHQVHIFLLKEIHGRLLGPRVGIAEVHILEALLHPDIIVVRDVDADGDIGARKSQDIKVGEVWLAELVLLEILGPREISYELLRVINEFIELCGGLLVDNGHEALELSSGARWIQVGLDETDVSLDDRADILDPVSLRVLVLFDTIAGKLLTKYFTLHS